MNTRYKPVAQKVNPVPGTLPDEFKIVRKFPEDPLMSLPSVPTIIPPFVYGSRLTEERWKKIENQLIEEKFLWPEEIKLVRHILGQNEAGIAWNDDEKGQFRTDYFEPVRFPTVAHVPWVEKNIRIPPSMYDQVIKELQRKIDMGIIEPSNSSYRSRWFCVPKKDGSPRIVWSLESLNAISIKDAGVPPILDEVIEGFAGRSCYTLFDLYIGYDHRLVDPASRDLTTFQTPLGTFRLTTLPMGYTNSVTIFHGDVTFLLQDEIPHVTQPFIDDVPIKGPKSDYRLPDGSWETLPNNPGIRRFIYEHAVDVNRVLHRIRHAGGTVSAKKIRIMSPEIVILGNTCTSYGRRADDSHLSKIRDWPIPIDLTGVRGFLGTMGLIRIFVKDFAVHASPLVSLTRKDVPFKWNESHQQAFDFLKQRAVSAPALKPIDYNSGNEVILSVDSSIIAVGFVLSQLDDDNKRHPARYGSITWNERESNYSQSKIELYGLCRALRAVRNWVIGLPLLIVEVDAEYIKGMLSNPDEIPNRTLNRWIAYIQLFNLEIRHVPAERHKGPDGLSRRLPTIHEVTEGPDDLEDEIDRALEVFNIEIPATTLEPSPPTTLEFIPPGMIQRSPESRKKDEQMEHIRHFLRHLKFSEDLDHATRVKLAKQVPLYFSKDNNLYLRVVGGNPRLYIPPERRLAILKHSHDDLGHRGYYPTRRLIMDRFYWPDLAKNVQWYLKTCDECQKRTNLQFHIPPIVPPPAPLMSKVHLDTMYMEKAGGYRMIAHARCSLSAWPEWRILQKETAETLGKFIFEEILCRWGTLREIVTDNGTPYVKALDWLAKTYHIHHIRISPYNSQAQGIVERQHRTIRESLVKACNGNIKQWPKLVAHIFWADRMTVRKSTGYSPFYLAHGIEPTLPFDLTEATYLSPELANDNITTADLIAARAKQLLKRPEDLRKMHDLVLRSRQLSSKEFERQFHATIKDFDFKPGAMVLVRNSQAQMDLGRKWKPRYIGPYIVLRRHEGGSYTLCEMDGAVSKLRFAAKRLIPYYLRSVHAIPDSSDPINAANEDVSED